MEAGELESIPFGENMDPKGILADMLGGSLIHTKENQVQYYQRYGDLGRNYKYVVNLHQ